MRRRLIRVASALLMASLLLTAGAALAGHSGQPRCTSGYDNCRRQRNGINGPRQAWLSWVTNPPETAFEVTYSCPGLVAANCTNGMCTFKRTAQLEAECNARNAERKRKLVACATSGLLEVTSGPPNCPAGPRRNTGVGCALGTDPRDIGNGDFKSCVATGPGPAMPTGANVQVAPGCCKILEVPNWEQHGTQSMASQSINPWGNSEFWIEDYIFRNTAWKIYGCNPAAHPQARQVDQTACLLTSEDIIIEGFSNAQGQGGNGPTTRYNAGWCNATTGSGAGRVNTVTGLLTDIFTVMSYLGSPKDRAPGRLCSRIQTAFNQHCGPEGSTAGIENFMAHSMGAIAATFYDAPVKTFAGSIVRPGSEGIWNNCDPVPWVTNLGYPITVYAAALSHQANMGANVTNYRLCEVVEQQWRAVGASPNWRATNCISGDPAPFLGGFQLPGVIRGTVLGPSNCAPVARPPGAPNNFMPAENFAACTFAPYCGARFNLPHKRNSGRSAYKPSECYDLNTYLTRAVSACFRRLLRNNPVLPFDGAKACISAAISTVAGQLGAQASDHLFNGTPGAIDYNGYWAYHANWGKPKDYRSAAVNRPQCCAWAVPRTNAPLCGNWPGVPTCANNECCNGGFGCIPKRTCAWYRGDMGPPPCGMKDDGCGGMLDCGPCADMSMPMDMTPDMPDMRGDMGDMADMRGEMGDMAADMAVPRDLRASDLIYGGDGSVILDGAVVDASYGGKPGPKKAGEPRQTGLFGGDPESGGCTVAAPGGPGGRQALGFLLAIAAFGIIGRRRRS